MCSKEKKYYDKEEYIKIFREVQNEIKSNVIDYQEFKRLHPRSTNE